MTSNKRSLFTSDDGKNLVFTFCLVSSLFLLWGFCNGMIDVMDRHFQQALHLTLAQSAWVQFAHWMGYFLMSLPAGWLAIRLGYKGGIIAGLLMVGLGGFWFVPASHIAAFWAFLLGVCVVAIGLTFLETVANPYTTVLGPKQFAATRINLAQSCNGVGWFFGPIAGGLFFYGKDAAGRDTGGQTLWIPYAGVAVVVLLLAVIFYFSPIPDIKTEDAYHLDEAGNDTNVSTAPRQVNRGPVYFLIVANSAALLGVFGMIFWVILGALDAGPHLHGLASHLPHPSGVPITDASAVVITLAWAWALCVLIAAVALFPAAKKISHHSIWSHEHFSGATLAQFFYVAAQAGIFSFLINYMISEPPPIPASWDAGVQHLASAFPAFTQSFFAGWFETNKNGVLACSNKFASYLASFGFLWFLLGRVTGAALLKRFAAHKLLGMYAVLNTLITFLVFCKLGWFSVVCVFLSYFFMSIMFPTIFALGIHGLGVRAKRASGYIVMGIVGGALLPKLMGAIADNSSMSTGFIVPMFCFVVVALYGYCWPRLSGADSLHVVGTAGGHPASLEGAPAARR
jgi:FHS family L-fucose permease-like MFS transporter